MIVPLALAWLAPLAAAPSTLPCPYASVLPWDGLADEVLEEVRSDWERIGAIDLARNPWRDKQRFLAELEEGSAFTGASAEERKAAAAAVLDWARSVDRPDAAWRAHELRARLLRRDDGPAAREALAAALDAYPEVRYDQPSKHSSFHHLANELALLDLELEGAAAAAKALVARAADPRMAAFYPEGIEPGFLAAGAAAELKGLYADLAKAFEERDPRLARELRERELPDMRTVDGDPRRTYAVIGADAKDAADERHLVVVMPGGNGQAAEFLPWITRIATPLTDRYLFAVLSAPVWTEEQASEYVWVTERVQKEYGAAFPVETFAREVAAELRGEAKGKTLLFAWSSGGPATYATILSKDRTFDGAYVLASVFKPEQLEVRRARGKRFVLEQGREDRVTPFRFAELAEKTLRKGGAEVKLEPFDGGHGFAMPDAAASLARALDWLVR